MNSRAISNFSTIPALTFVLVTACGGSDSNGSGQIGVGGGAATTTQGGAVNPSGGSGPLGSGVGVGGTSPLATTGNVVGAGGATGTSVGTNGTSVGTGGTTVSITGTAVGTGGTTVGTVVGTGGKSGGTGGSTVGTGGKSGGTGGSTVGSGGTTSATGGKSSGTGGTTSATGGATGQDNPVCEVADPSKFQLNTKVGGGGSNYTESPHFVVFGASAPDTVIKFMEAAQKCFVEDWCWRSPGLSITSTDGKYSKFNIYAIANLSAGGYMGYDGAAGLSYIQVLAGLEARPDVTVHEFGHALTLAAKGWVDQGNTGFWWESVANFVADTYQTSPFCDAARKAFGVTAGNTIIDLGRTIGNAQWAICMSQNYYQAWPFFTYLTNNPDNYAGLGRMTLPNLFKNHKGNNETPLHVLERLAAPVTVQTILGRYWARMAYLDIGHPKAQTAFLNARSGLNFKNLASSGTQTYKPLANRQPQYGGANIIPLKVSGTGDIAITVSNLGNGLTESNFTATLSIRANSGTVRYVDLPSGKGQATISSTEEASLVVVNTPKNLYMYDPSKITVDASSEPASKGLNYEVQLTGATPAN